MSQSVPPVSLNVPPTPGFPVKRFLSTITGIIIFAIVSSFALLYALGFRVNWAAKTFQRTGLIELQSPHNIPADVHISGLDETLTLPARQPWLLPGNYTVTVTRDGYVPWARSVDVGQNQRVKFSSVILLYKTPKTVDAPTIRIEDLQPTENEVSGLEVRNKSEIWINEEFITRLSEDVLSLRWYTEKDTIVYQIGDRLVLADVDGRYTQEIITTTTKNTLPYTFREGGRVLVYQDGEDLKAVELFEKLSFIDRLTPER